MTRYFVHAADSPFVSAEFATADGTRHAFFELRAGADVSAALAKLHTADAQLKLLAQTPTATGTLLTTSSTASSETLLNALAAQDVVFTPQTAAPKKFNPWAWRGYTSILGQSLQIASSVKGTGTAADRAAVLGFAALNLTANIINIIFGAQEKNDPHQLRYLKEQFNHQLAPHVKNGALPDIARNQLSQYPATDKNKTFGLKTYGFLEKYSVSFGEIFLRTLGTISLAFPVTGLGAGLQTLRETKSLGQAFRKIKNPNPATFTVGLIMLLGKFTSFTAKEPDPFNPNPPSLLDRFREKAAFRLSSIIEGGAASWMAYDRFHTQKILLGGKPKPDYFGGYGNVVFVGGYGVRLAAPYGSLEVNRPELYAHIASGLAHAPAAQLPELLAQSATTLQQHFAAKPETVSDYYQALANELAKHHGIHLGEPAANLPGMEPTLLQHLPATKLAAEPRLQSQRLSEVSAQPALA